jgi:hypothetical protein
MVHDDGTADMFPEATYTVTSEVFGPPGPEQLRVYVVSDVKGEVICDPVSFVPTETLLNSPPSRVHAVAFATPFHERTVPTL